MLILALAQCLVGGGWVLDLGIFTSVFGSRINHPLNWWRKHLPMNVRPILVSLWPWSVLGYSLLSLLLLIATVMGVNNASIVKYTLSIATAMIIPIPIMILGAIAHDIQ